MSSDTHVDVLVVRWCVPCGAPTRHLRIGADPEGPALACRDCGQLRTLTEPPDPATPTWFMGVE